MRRRGDNFLHGSLALYFFRLARAHSATASADKPKASLMGAVTQEMVLNLENCGVNILYKKFLEMKLVSLLFIQRER